MPFNLALEANNPGRILDFVLALLLVALGLVLVIGDESKSTFVIRGFLNTQNIFKCGFPFMTFFQVFLQRSDLGLELFDFLYMCRCIEDKFREEGSSRRGEDVGAIGRRQPGR